MESDITKTEPQEKANKKIRPNNIRGTISERYTREINV